MPALASRLSAITSSAIAWGSASSSRARATNDATFNAYGSVIGYLHRRDKSIFIIVFGLRQGQLGEGISTRMSATELLNSMMAALLERARDAATRAYVPYSNFPVGAALLTESG